VVEVSPDYLKSYYLQDTPSASTTGVIAPPVKHYMLDIPGKPAGKDRPRVVRRGDKIWTFTPKKTELAEGEIRRHWEAKNLERLDEVAIGLTVTLFVERPNSHFTSKGALSATGKRHPLPRNQKPDIDNALKLIMDALNGRAWRDDVQISSVKITREWSMKAHTLIWIKPLTGDSQLF
jgi:Holliday junction resolvase RusA-like endonuclease